MPMINRHTSAETVFTATAPAVIPCRKTAEAVRQRVLKKTRKLRGAPQAQRWEFACYFGV